MNIDIQIINDSSFKFLPRERVVKKVNNVFKNETRINEILLNIIYIDDEVIWEINKKYLKHNRVTDVITFSLSDNNKIIEGEIYISVETAKRQAEENKVSLSNELLRLAIHGALHLAGYEDDTENKRLLMHNLENKYLE